MTERHRQLPAWIAPHVHTSADGVALNASATAIRDLCAEGRTLFDVVAALRQRYIGDDVDLYVDVTSALLELRRLGLIGWSPGARSRPATRFVVGIEDKTYFHWQLPILFESLIGQLPKDWDILLVVCNNHQPLSGPLRHICESYGVTWFTGASHPAHQNMDFAAGDDYYAPLNRIEALRVVAPHVRDDDLVFLLDTDNFLYRELDPAIFPTGNALHGNEIIDQRPFFTHDHDGVGVDLQKILRAVGCRNRFTGGGVAVFLSGQTVKNTKFVDDCFRFTQVVYLLGKIAGLSSRRTWIAEMPCFALSLTANAIPYLVLDGQSFMVAKPLRVAPGTFYHYYGDLKDTGVDGAFYDSDWHKQPYFHADFLTTNLDDAFRAAVTPHEQYFFELAKRARRRLATSGGVDRPGPEAAGPQP
jgi:hypothetical protein